MVGLDLRTIQKRFHGAYRKLIALENAQKFFTNVIPQRLEAALHGTTNTAAYEGKQCGNMSNNNSDKSRFTTIDNNIPYWQNLNKLSNAMLTKQNEMHQLLSLLQEDDSELKAIAENEKIALECELDDIAKELINAIMPSREHELLSKCQLEITAGVGGVEAMLFASELSEMYRNFAQFKNWTWNVMQQDNVQLGGIRSVLISVCGDEVYSQMRFEAGVHRVQRVPVTDKTRMHTSTASVSVLPEPNKVDAYVSSNDVKIETMRASGPGGQNVNKRSTAVRVTHKPTGISVHCMDERFQHLNIQIAFRRLAAILMQKKLDEIDEHTSSARRLQVGSKSRAEKVRTYNFKDDRITDHRLRRSWTGVAEMMLGGAQLEEVILHLRDAHKLQLIDNFFHTFS